MCDGIWHNKDDILFEERAMMSIQTISTRYTSICCCLCGRYLMDWRIQAAISLGNLFSSKKSREYYRSTLIQSGQAYGCLNPKCDELFCSLECRQQSVQNGHLLECGVMICDILQLRCSTESIDVICSNYASEFRKHSLKSNEVFLATRRLISTMIAPMIFSETKESNLYYIRVIIDILEQFPILINSSTPLSIQDSSLMDYLSSFLPKDETCYPSDYDSIHESWLLFYALFVDIGVNPREYSIILSWELYYYLSKYLLPTHLRSTKLGFVNQLTPSISSMSPLHSELLSVCLNRNINLQNHSRHTIEELEDITISDVLDALFPDLFLTSVQTSNGCNDIEHISQGCKLLQLLSILQQDKSAGLSSRNQALDECIENGIRHLEKGVSMFMVLLPRCSSSGKHSCCPTAHFSYSPSSVRNRPLLNETRPSSSNMIFSIVCLREYYSSPSGNGVPQTSTEIKDGFSLSLAPESLAYDSQTRQKSLSHLLFSIDSHNECRCFRCLVEVHGLEFALTELYDTPSPISPDGTLSIVDSPSVFTLLMGLSYTYMVNHQMDQARSLLRLLLKSILHSNFLHTNFLHEKLVHALGASYLEVGDWKTAHTIWRDHHLIGNHITRSTNSYQPLQAEIVKMSSYPVIEVNLKVTNQEKVSIPSAESIPLLSLVTWPTKVNIFDEEISSSFHREVTSYCPLTSRNIIPDSTISQEISYFSLNSRIFLTKTPVLTPSECAWVITLAEQEAMKRSESGASGWSTSRHYAVPTTDIPVQEIPELLTWFNCIMKEKIGPMIVAQMMNGGDIDQTQSVHINIHDAFVVKYDSGIEISEYLKNRLAVTPSSTRPIQRLLPLHTDQSSHSFVLTLNHPFHETDPPSIQSQSFLGGGTYFPSENQVMSPDIGHMVFFSGGKIVHGGLPVIAGVRYILPVFLFISSSSLSATALAKHKLEESVAGDNNNEEVNTWIKGWEAPAQKKETKKPKIDFTGKESGGKSHTFSFEF